MFDWIKALFTGPKEASEANRVVRVAMGSSGSEEPGDSRLLERLVFEATCHVRREQGLNSLGPDRRLRQVAWSHSQDMCARRYFAHESPDGEGPGDRVDRHYPEFVGGSGENIFMIDTDHDAIQSPADAQRVAERLMDGWMKSPGHRANILRRTFDRLGVGVYATEDDVYATQLFGTTLAVLGTPMPASVAPGSPIEVSAELGGALAAGKVTALLEWPDRKRRFPIPGQVGRYRLGSQELEVNNSKRGPVVVRFTAPDSSGLYRLRLGTSGSFYEVGKLRVT